MRDGRSVEAFHADPLKGGAQAHPIAARDFGILDARVRTLLARILAECGYLVTGAAADRVMAAMGGSLILTDSPLGGLKARLVLPAE
ncbi:hypothetical protein SAMN02927924_03068 [Sphingobium faniae]|nr:hypothetical protein SAMN02927924_03068 [Sphingobium faniae]